MSIARAFARRRLARGRKITQPALAFEYLQVLLQDYEHEVFSAVFLDSQHRVIRFEELFRGTRARLQKCCTLARCSSLHPVPLPCSCSRGLASSPPLVHDTGRDTLVQI